MNLQISDFPTLDAILNATSAVLLALGYIFIRRKNVRAHKLCMVSAVVTSTLFLVFYLTYHYFHGATRFTGQGAVRSVYFAILGSHTVLAAAIVPLVLTTLYRALRGRFELHKRIARWTLPLWLYVSVTGVVVYWMLYHLYPSSR
jgi:putative membrane protein